MNAQKDNRIVILGGGFAGAYCAEQLSRDLHRDEAQVLLIDEKNYLTFYPLLVEASTGALEPRHAVVPLRKLLRRAAFHMASVHAVDLAQQVVSTRALDGTERDWPYDQLVLALGSVTNLPDVPGLPEYGFSIKSMADAVALRDRAIAMLELADQTQDPQHREELLTYVVVGGNYTGVEVAGEMNEFLAEAVRAYPRVTRRDVNVVLVERESRILHMLDADLSDYATDRLCRRDVDVRLSDSVTQIEERRVKLQSGDTLSTRTVIWAAGIAPHPLMRELDVPHDKRGYVLCDPDLRVKGHENIWAIGDSAVNPNPRGKPYPPTAQHAVREGRQASANIVRVMRGQSTEALDYRSKGMMAPLGKHQAVAKVFGIKLSGLPAWLMWRTFYVLRMPGFGRRLRVIMDWSLDWFFRRDCIQLGIHGTHQPRADNREMLDDEPEPATDGDWREARRTTHDGSQHRGALNRSTSVSVQACTPEHTRSGVLDHEE